MLIHLCLLFVYKDADISANCFLSRFGQLHCLVLAGLANVHNYCCRKVLENAVLIERPFISFRTMSCGKSY